MIYLLLVLLAGAAIFFSAREKKNKEPPAAVKERETPKEEKPKEQEQPPAYPVREINVSIVKDGIKTEGVLKDMPQGLQVFNSAGEVILDTNNFTFKQFGIAETGIIDGELVDSRITEKTVIVPFSLGIASNERNEYARTPILTVAPGKIKWWFVEPVSPWIKEISQKIGVNFFYGEWR